MQRWGRRPWLYYDLLFLSARPIGLLPAPKPDAILLRKAAERQPKGGRERVDKRSSPLARQDECATRGATRIQPHDRSTRYLIGRHRRRIDVRGDVAQLFDGALELRRQLAEAVQHRLGARVIALRLNRK